MIYLFLTSVNLLLPLLLAVLFSYLTCTFSGFPYKSEAARFRMHQVTDRKGWREGEHSTKRRRKEGSGAEGVVFCVFNTALDMLTLISFVVAWCAAWRFTGPGLMPVMPVITVIPVRDARWRNNARQRLRGSRHHSFLHGCGVYSAAASFFFGLLRANFAMVAVGSRIFPPHSKHNAELAHIVLHVRLASPPSRA